MNEAALESRFQPPEPAPGHLAARPATLDLSFPRSGQYHNRRRHRQPEFRCCMLAAAATCDPRPAATVSALSAGASRCLLLYRFSPSVRFCLYLRIDGRCSSLSEADWDATWLRGRRQEPHQPPRNLPLGQSFGHHPAGPPTAMDCRAAPAATGNGPCRRPLPVAQARRDSLAAALATRAGARAPRPCSASGSTLVAESGRARFARSTSAPARLVD